MRVSFLLCPLIVSGAACGRVGYEDANLGRLSVEEPDASEPAESNGGSSQSGPGSMGSRPPPKDPAGSAGGSVSAGPGSGGMNSEAGAGAGGSAGGTAGASGTGGSSSGGAPSGGAGSGLPCDTPPGLFVYSHSPDHAVTMLLEGATISSTVYIRFLDCDSKNGATFDVNGNETAVQTTGPYDLLGDWEGVPRPFMPEFFGVGDIDLTATLRAPSTGSGTTRFRTAQGVVPPGLYLTNISRSSYQPLEGATLTGDAFVVLLPSLFNPSVDFELTDGGMPLLTKFEGGAPLDLMGNGARPAPLPTTDYANGQYTVNAVEDDDVTAVSHTARFTIQN